MRLRFTTYRVADPGTRFGWNRYYAGTCCEQVIGAGVVFGSRAFGVTWRSPRAPSLDHDRRYHY